MFEVKSVRVTLPEQAAKRAGILRYHNTKDKGVTTKTQAHKYKGAEFVNRGRCTKLRAHFGLFTGDLHLSFVDSKGTKQKYLYPKGSYARAKIIRK